MQNRRSYYGTTTVITPIVPFHLRILRHLKSTAYQHIRRSAISVGISTIIRNSIKQNLLNLPINRIGTVNVCRAK